MTKNDIIEEYEKVCSHLCKRPEDYTKSKVKKHNRAMRKLIALDKELAENRELAYSVYGHFLDSRDEYLQMHAAAACLKVDIHIEKAVSFLEWVVQRGEPWTALPAERVLKIWRGELDPRKPF